jgi:4'-phosphopantetheinyl transferase
VPGAGDPGSPWERLPPNRTGGIAQGARAGPPGYRHGVRVFAFDLEHPRSWVEAAADAVLSEAERRQRGERFEVWRRRVVSRVGLRLVLAEKLGCAPEAVPLATDAHGRPRLVDSVVQPPPIWFNLTRYEDRCLIVLSSRGRVGIDAETVHDLPEISGIVRRHFDRAEAAAIEELSGDRRRRAFFRCWTRKEAYLKGVGVGLSAGLRSVSVTVGERPAVISAVVGRAAEWSLVDLDLGAGVIGAVAFECADGIYPLSPIAPEFVDLA